MFKRIFYACLLGSVFLASSEAFANSHISRAPIGIMGDHNHGAGQWMTSYRYSRMNMSGNRDGGNSISTSDVLKNYMVSPLDMAMEMHMFGLMYGVRDDLTFMGMVPYVRKTMSHVNRMNVNFKTKSAGIGDVKLSGIYTLFDSGAEHKKMGHNHIGSNTLLNFGVTLPTGSIDNRDNTPMGYQKLPYPMQIGSGTFNPNIGISYSNNNDSFSWGAKADGILRFGKNDEGYRLGNEYIANLWAAKNVSEEVNLSARIEGKSWGDVNGKDSDLNPMMVPTARADLRGGTRADALFGFGIYTPKLGDSRVAIEFGLPLYQNLDGPQLETDYRLTLGWQIVF